MTCQDMEYKEFGQADDSFIFSLAVVLTHLVSIRSGTNHQKTRFHAVKPPDITIKDYLERIQKHFACSNECFVLALVYIDRIIKLYAEFPISILNIHRLLITSMMLAAKFFDDTYYSNAFYAQIGGVQTKEINSLEWQFLALIKYRLFVSPHEFEQYRNHVLVAVNSKIQRPLKVANYNTNSNEENSHNNEHLNGYYVQSQNYGCNTYNNFNNFLSSAEQPGYMILKEKNNNIVYFNNAINHSHINKDQLQSSQTMNKQINSAFKINMKNSIPTQLLTAAAYNYVTDIDPYWYINKTNVHQPNKFAQTNQLNINLTKFPPKHSWNLKHQYKSKCVYQLCTELEKSNYFM